MSICTYTYIRTFLPLNIHYFFILGIKVDPNSSKVIKMSPDDTENSSYKSQNNLTVCRWLPTYIGEAFGLRWFTCNDVYICIQIYLFMYIYIRVYIQTCIYIHMYQITYIDLCLSYRHSLMITLLRQHKHINI
jgi:hypothetical protein